MLSVLRSSILQRSIAKDLSKAASNYVEFYRYLSAASSANSSAPSHCQDPADTSWTWASSAAALAAAAAAGTATCGWFQCFADSTPDTEPHQRPEGDGVSAGGKLLSLSVRQRIFFKYEKASAI